MDSQLHQAARCIATSPRAKLAEQRFWAEFVSDLSKQGLVNDLDEEGNTPLGIICQAAFEWNLHIGYAIGVLIENGANPLAYDNALLKMANNPHIRDQGCLHLLNEMLEEEATNKVRDSRGQNPLHWLSQFKPVILATILPGWDRTSPGYTHLKHWAVEQSKEGSTPLHCLWEDFGSAVVLKGLKCDIQNESRASVAWLAQDCLVDLGADLYERGGRAIAPVDMSMALAKLGMPVLPSVTGKQVAAEMLRRELDAGTPTGSMKPGKSVRL